jgi:hypothetical protein
LSGAWIRARFRSMRLLLALSFISLCFTAATFLTLGGAG